MTYAIAIDDRGGMAFLGRRLSRDRTMWERLRAFVGERTLLILPYSQKTYGERAEVVTDASVRRENAVLFLETVDPTPYLRKGDELLVYSFGRPYPSDLVCAALPHLTEQARTPFVGATHPDMTETLYRVP